MCQVIKCSIYIDNVSIILIVNITKLPRAVNKHRPASEQHLSLVPIRVLIRLRGVTLHVVFVLR